MADQEKQFRNLLESALGQGPLPFTASNTATAWIGLLLLVKLNQSLCIQAKVLPGMVLQYLGQRKVSELPATWHHTLIAHVAAAEAITSTEKFDKFIAKLGDGKTTGALAQALDSPHALAVLFPSGLERQHAVEQIVAALPKELFNYAAELASVLDVFWDSNNAAVLIAHTMASTRYAKQLAQQLACEQQHVIQHFTTAAQKTIESGKTGTEQLGELKKQYQILRVFLQRMTEATAPAPGVTVAAITTQPQDAPTPPTAASASSLSAEQLAAVVVAAVKTAMPTHYMPPAQRVHKNSNNAGDRSSSNRTIKCYKCGEPNHVAAHCLASEQDGQNKNVKSKNDSKRYDASFGALVVQAIAQARPTAEPHQLAALIDTGASLSVVDEATARKLGCIITKWQGPELETAGQTRLHVVGETRLSLELGEWAGQLGPLPVVRDLAFPIIVGTSEMRRAGALWVDWRVSPPAVRLGQPTAQVATIFPALEGVETLEAASRLAADAERALNRIESTARARATAVPAAMGAQAAAKAQPAIDFYSKDEVEHRAAHRHRNRDAHKSIELGPTLPAPVRAELQELAQQYAGVFSIKDLRFKPPVINTHLPDAHPIQLHLRPYIQVRSQAQPPYASTRDRELLEAERDVLLEQGRAIPAVRALAIGTAFVTKGPRVVHDATQANAILLGTAHTLPGTDGIARALADFDGDYYVQFDFEQGFNQVPYARGSGAAACVSVAGTTLEPLVASMGVSCIPGEFHALVSRIFTIKPEDKQRWPALEHVLVHTFIDDGGVACRGEAALLAAVHFVLDRCERYGFTLNALKFRAGFRSMVFAGVEIEGRALRPLHSYTQTILQHGRPNTRAEMMSFLGMVGWVQPHLHAVFEDIATLRSLLKKSGTSAKAQVAWSSEGESAFKRVRSALADPAVLYAFDANRTLFALTDASTLSGACLFMQLYTVAGAPTLRLVNAMCYNFSAAERNYTTAEQELAALREARQRLPHLMLGRTVIWLTDNTAVAELLRSARISKRRRLARTYGDLQGTHIVSVHIAGSMNTLADALSRNPALSARTQKVDEEADVVLEIRNLVNNNVIAAVNPVVSESVLERESLGRALERVRRLAPGVLELAAELQLQDESLVRVLEAAATGAVWRGNVFQMLETDSQRLLFAREPANANDKYGGAERRLRLVLPRGLRQPVLEVMHSATGHGGLKHLTAAVQRAFWWPSVAADTDKFLEACDACKRATSPKQAGNVGDAERDPLLKPTRPGDVYQFDSWQCLSRASRSCWSCRRSTCSPAS